MILFFRFFALFFCFSSFSQQIESEQPLLVKKDSVSFYSFTKKGVTLFRFNDQGKAVGDFVDYERSLPKSLQPIALDALESVSNGEVVYFLYPGGGILYVYKNNIIKRIDESFAHRDQLSGKFFMYNKALYLLGGYGYWRSKSNLLKYDFQNGSWSLISTFGQIPEKGINKGSFLIKDNLVYVFDFYETSGEINNFNPNLYTLNLNTFKWIKKGNLNSFFSGDILKSSLINKVYLQESVIYKVPHSLFVQKISPFSNTITTYAIDNENLIPRKSIVLGNKLIYYVIGGDRSQWNITFQNLGDILRLKSKAYMHNDMLVFKNYFLVAGALLLILILTLFLYFKKSSKVFFLSSDSIFAKEKSVSLDENEYYFLKLLTNSKNGDVENTTVLNHFKNDLMSLDSSIKRKNSMIRSLNVKCFDHFKVLLIEKKPSLKDSRQVCYNLNPSIKIVSKKF